MRKFGLNFANLNSQFSQAIAADRMQNIVLKNDADYKNFVQEFYYENQQTDFRFNNAKGVEVVFPFSLVSMFEFIVFTVVNDSVWVFKPASPSQSLPSFSPGVPADKELRVASIPRVVLHPKNHFVSDTKFNPHLFHSLHVYTNIVQPVDYNDQQFKLLDIIFLKPNFENENAVIEHRSNQFQVVDVDTLSEIRITILTALGQPAPFIHGPVFVVLQFQDFQHV